MKKHVPILALILLLAIGLRVYRLSDVDLRFDASSALQQARGIVEGRWVAFSHNSGSVIEHPPLFLYVMALPFLVTREYLAAVVWHIAFDAAAIVVVYVAAARQGWRAAAIVAALSLATSPWSVQFARSTELVAPPLFAALCVWGLLEGAGHRKPWGWALASIGAALTTGAHWAGAYLIAVVLIVALAHRRAVAPRALALGFIPLLLVGGAYLAANGAALQARFAAATEPARASSFPWWRPLAVDFALWSSGGMHLADLTGPSYGEWIKDPLTNLGWIDSLQIALLLTGLAIACGAAGGVIPARTVRRTPAHGVLAIAWLLPVGMLLLGPLAPTIRYLLPVVPTSALLMGLTAQAGLEFAHARQRTRIFGAIAALLMLTISAWQIYVTVRFAQFSGAFPVAIRPARPLLTVAALAKNTRAAGLNEDLIIVANGDDLPWDEAVVNADAALSGIPHRFLNGNNDGMILRAGGGHYVFLPGTERARDRLLALSEPPGTTTRVSQFGEDFDYVVAGRLKSGFTPVDPARWRHGLTLQSAAWQRLPDRAVLRLQFVVEAPPPPGSDFHWFHQLYAGGDAVARLDSQGVHPHYWRLGDIVVHQIEFPIDAGTPLKTPLVARIGSYAYPQNGTREDATLSYGKVTNEVDAILVP